MNKTWGWILHPQLKLLHYVKVLGCCLESLPSILLLGRARLRTWVLCLTLSPVSKHTHECDAEHMMWCWRSSSLVRASQKLPAQENILWLLIHVFVLLSPTCSKAPKWQGEVDVDVLAYTTFLHLLPLTYLSTFLQKEYINTAVFHWEESYESTYFIYIYK